jgi:hypothetical protein
VVSWFDWSAAVLETSRSIFNTLRLTLRAPPRSEELQIRTLPAGDGTGNFPGPVRRFG